ncbi:MAG: S53 family peptidase [Candidatus Sulfotelmatobacter sp.]
MSRRWAVPDQLFASLSLRLKIFSTIIFAVISANAPGQAKVTGHSQPMDRIISFIDDEQRVTLYGNRHPLATPENDIGAVAPEYPVQHMVMTLLADAAQQQSLDQLVQGQYEPESANYHQWLTPEQYAESFGVSESDIAQITAWLIGHGFEVEEVAAGHRSIIFSGNAAQVQQAFHTEIHSYLVNGAIHHANARDPEIPAALAQVVGGVVSLHDFRSSAMHTLVRKASPEFSSGGAHYLAPADFATIYDLDPVYLRGSNGSGQSIAIDGRSNIYLSDVAQFRSYFGLPANNLQIIVNGTDPGIWSSDEESEADLDVEWSGAVARNAAVKLVVSKSTNTTDGIDLSAEYIVDHNTAPVMSVSFGVCEAWLGSTGNAFFSSLWEQAAAEGITVFVASGDTGAAGCDSPTASTATYGPAVNGLCSTPYSVCVGGTQLNDVATPSLYWSALNSSGTQESALSYIPEVVWNESGRSLGLWASGGGASAIYAKPTWQSGTGVRADGKRDVPDVALTAAGHDGYLIFQNGGLYVVGGTSAATPSFAGIMALVLQNTATRQGNANVVFYPLAGKQRSGGEAAFHDITVGNNSVPGETGFNATAGYDEATGLGSVDGSVLVNDWGDGGIRPAFHVTASVSSLVMSGGSSNTIDFSVSASGGFNAAVGFSVSGLPSGVSGNFTPATLAAPGTGSSVLRLTARNVAKTGVYSATVTAASGSTRQAIPVSVTVEPSRTSLHHAPR